MALIDRNFSRNLIIMLNRLLFIGLMLFSAQLSAQNIVYERFDGYIGNGSSIQMNLTHKGTAYEGNYFLKAVDTVSSKLRTGYQWIKVKGKREGNTLKLNEFDGKGAQFTAEFAEEGEALNGSWQDGSRKESLQFNMRISYPEGSMKFNYLSENIDAKLFDMSPEPSMEIYLACPVPDFSLHAGNVEHAVDEQIAEMFYRNAAIKTNTPANMQEYERALIRAYREKNDANFTKERMDLFLWKKKQEIDIVFNFGYVLSLGMRNLAYSGGSRSMEQKQYRVISLKNGRQIHLNEIVDSTDMETLSRLIEKQLRENYDLDEDTPLSKAGFFSDSLPVTQNFYVTNAGIGFVYNLYEIAGHENGIIEINVSKEFLREICLHAPAEILALWY